MSSSHRTPIIGVTGTSDLAPATARGTKRVRVNAAYVRAVEAAGALPVVLPPLADASRAAELLAPLDGLLLTGGEDIDPARYGATPHPTVTHVNAERDATEIALVLAARARGLPTLAICRGIQVLNVAFGGTLVQDIPSQWPGAMAHDAEDERDARVHDVTVEADSALALALGTASLRANSFHHQAVERIAHGLTITARAPDGVVEGAEWTDDDWWALGVQWHPEELVGSSEGWDRALFRALVARAAIDAAPAISVAR
jgi:putative glutamine amidotransferase